MRVAITGIGVIGPHGVGTDVYWAALCEGRSGIRTLTAEALQGLAATAGGEIPDFDATAYMERRVARRMGRFSQLAVAATTLALADAGIDELDAERTGITVHTGAGGIIEGDRELLARANDPGRIGPLYVPLLSANMGAANVAIHFGVTGPVTAGVGQRERGGRHRELGEPPHPARDPALDEVGRIEIGDLTAGRRLEPLQRRTGELADARASLAEGLPVAIGADPVGADDADAGDRDAHGR